DRRRVDPPVLAHRGGLPGAVTARRQVLGAGPPDRPGVRRPQPGLLLPPAGVVRRLTTVQPGLRRPGLYGTGRRAGRAGLRRIGRRRRDPGAAVGCDQGVAVRPGGRRPGALAGPQPAEIAVTSMLGRTGGWPLLVDPGCRGS